MSTSKVPELKPIVQRAANLQTYDQVRAAIAGGRFKPGDTLSTRQFAEALAVSQMPVREAFHRLVAEGALENRPNRTIGLPLVGKREFEDLTEIRLNLEGLATEKAAALLARKDITSLKHLLERMEAARGTPAYLEMNRQFHFAIYEGSGSGTLVRLITQLWLRVGPLLNWSAQRTDNVIRSSRFHRDVVSAFEGRDGSAAKSAMVNDIREAADIVVAQLERP